MISYFEWLQMWTRYHGMLGQRISKDYYAWFNRCVDETGTLDDAIRCGLISM